MPVRQLVRVRKYVVETFFRRRRRRKPLRDKGGQFRAPKRRAKPAKR